jgi:class 3 adenylate cyclase
MFCACPKCGQATPSGRSHCHACRTPLGSKPLFEPGGELRITTILFSDMVGYTALNERQEPEAVSLILDEVKRRARVIVERHGGQVTQYVGDEIMSLFGYPLAHDDDLIRCARAARELHEMVQELSASWVEPTLDTTIRLHSGFATGEVFVRESNIDNIGGKYTVYGTAVNRAARLRSHAGPDSIWCCPTSYACIRDYFECEANPQVVLDESLPPMTVYRLGEPTTVQRQFDVATRRGLTRWTGRDEELSELTSWLERVADGSGHAIVVCGEAGVGKTRLAYEFGQQIPSTRYATLAGYCQPSGNTGSYAPLVDALRGALGLEPGMFFDELHRHAVDGISKLDPALLPYLPHLLFLLNIPSREHRLSDKVSDEILLLEMRQALALVFKNLARRKPTVVILDDWHWADDASREFLDGLLAEVHETPLLFLILTRPPLGPTWNARANVSLLGLDTLEPGQARAVLEFVIGASGVPDNLCERIYERTGGNALFTEEIGRSLLESGAVTVNDGQVILTKPLDELQLPLLLQSVIQARLDMLDSSSRETLKIASVVGRVFDEDVLTKVSPAPDTVAAGLAELLKRDLVHQMTSTPPIRYRFKHAVIQEATYGTLLHARRRELHAAVAAALESLPADQIVDLYEILGFHYRKALVVDKAARYLGYAAQRSSQLYQIARAMDQYLSAIRLMDSVELTEDLQRMRIEFALALGRRAFIKPLPEVYQILLASYQIAQTLGDKRLLAHTALTLGNVSWLESRFDAAREHLRESMAIAEQNGFATIAAAAQCSYGHTMFYSADFPSGIAQLENATKTVEGGQNRVLIYNVNNYLALQYGFTGQFERAYELQQAILDDAVGVGHRFIEQATRLWSSLGKSLQGDWQGALALCDAAIAIGYTTDAKYMEGYSRCSRAHARFMSGCERDDALREFADSLALLEQVGHKLAVSMYEAWFAEICALSGDLPRAHLHAEKALACRERHEYTGEVVALRALAIAESLARSPDWNHVDALLATSLALAEQRMQRPDYAITCLRRGEILARRGEQTAAIDALDGAAQCFSTLKMDWWMHALATAREGIKCGYRGVELVPYLPAAAALAKGA